jgi:hypothetical protein
MDPHHFRKLDPHPHPDPIKSGKLDPDPHQSEKQDPDPHQSEKLEALKGQFGSLDRKNLGKGDPDPLLVEIQDPDPLLVERQDPDPLLVEMQDPDSDPYPYNSESIWIRIKVKSSIRFPINVMRIRNTDKLYGSTPCRSWNTDGLTSFYPALLSRRNSAPNKIFPVLMQRTSSM